MKSKQTRKGGVCIAAGVLLIGLALGLTCYNLWDDTRAAAAAGESYGKLEELIPQGEEVWQGTDGAGEIRYPDYVLVPDLEMPTVEIDGNEYIGTLEIPALGLSLPVLSQWSYPNLKLGPCRYTGSAYRDDLVIAAHNYRSHFARLKDLKPGDAVIFTDADGNSFTYEMVLLETLAPTAIEEMSGGDYDLTLFTCTYGGQSRVTVRCERVE